MDVTCERCGTEYEFDETLVSDRGTTVKCTNCGHLFKVFRPDAAGSQPKTWTVRTSAGRTLTLGSLKELQRLITDGQLSPQDRISRGDEPPKHLGDIAELSTFFAAAASTAEAPPVRQRTRTKRGVSPNPAAHAPTAPARSVPPADPAADTIAEPPRSPGRRPQSTLIGHASASEAPDPPARPPAPPKRPRPPRPPARPAASPPVPAKPPRPAKPSSRPPLPSPASREPTAKTRPADTTAKSRPRKAERALYLDDKEAPAPERGKSRSGLWVMLVVLLAAAVGVALGWPQIAPMLGLAPEADDPAEPHTTAGDEALAGDTVDAYETAVHHYTQALAYDDHDVRVLSRLSRAHALWAQAVEFDAADLEARAGEDPALQGEANALRRVVRRHAETALQRAEDAVRYASGDGDAEAALADGLRLTGDTPRARSRLERALTLSSAPSAEALRVQALLDAAEHDGDLTHARENAEAAVGEDPSMIRARLLFARAALAANEVSVARSQIDAVLRRDGRHPRASALRDAIDQGVPPAPPTVDVPDGGVPDAGVEPDTSESETTEPETEPDGQEDPTSETPAASSGSASGGGGNRVPRGRDYNFYIRRGDELLENGNPSAARGFYEAAQGIRANGPDALTGLGYVALEGGNTSQAAAQFRRAASQGYAEAYIGLGQAYRRMNQNENALEAYERYLQRLPSGRSAPIARRQVEDLRRVVGTASTEPTPSEPEPSTPTPSEPDAPTEPPPGATPATPPGTLPPPRDQQAPAPVDEPAIDSEP
ncbi:MAG: tetratricopeptide repeat protein [Sandaracinaceae bacterium]